MKPDVSLVIPVKMAESLGVPGANINTVTTNTLTPTTLKTITQIFESDDCLSSLKKFDETGGFAPPLVPTQVETKVPKTQSFVNNQAWQGGTTTVVTPSQIILPANSFAAEVKEELEVELKSPVPDRSNSGLMTRRSSRIAGTRPAGYRYAPPSPDVEEEEQQKTKTKAKRTGGRKPAKHRCDEDLSPEEEERVRVRRLRNKEAAARCRKRRVDLTNSLLKEVESHEAKKQHLEEEIQVLKGQKEELEFILEAHRGHCQFGLGHPGEFNAPVVAIKSEPVLVEPASAPYIVPDPLLATGEEMKERMGVKRPASLSINTKSTPKEIQAGVVIETPSTNIPCLSFDTVTTGLTPCGPVASIVTPIITPTLNTPTNCSSQQRTMEVSDINTSSPEFVSL